VKQSLIIFARFPRQGEVKTRLAIGVGQVRAAEIYAEFSEHAFVMGENLRKASVEVYLFYDPLASSNEIRSWIKRPFHIVPQNGVTLGDRMKDAFERTFRAGADASVIIGTDVPELDQATVDEAFERLKNHEVVIGPSTDGGYYLLGMRSPAKNLFNGIAWSTQSVFERTVERLRESELSFSLLKTLTDIDTPEDYVKYLKRCRNPLNLET